MLISDAVVVSGEVTILSATDLCWVLGAAELDKEDQLTGIDGIIDTSLWVYQRSLDSHRRDLISLTSYRTLRPSHLSSGA